MSSRILPEFELLVPQSVEEAVSLLSKYGEGAAVMAGGTDLMVHLKSYGERTAFMTGRTDPAHQLSSVRFPQYVLSLSEIPALDYVDFTESEGLRIGATATLAQVVDAPAVKERFPAIWKSAAENGTVQTRNAATVVGNLLRGSPAGDCCCAALACGGWVVLQGPDGKRKVDVDEFWTGYRKTARRPDELALEVRIPTPENGEVSAFNCLTRVKEDISKINAAVRLSMEGKVCRKARLAMGCVAERPIRLKKTEALLEDREIVDGLYEELKESVGSEISPIDDVRSSSDYRRQVAGVLINRTIQAACSSL